MVRVDAVLAINPIQFLGGLTLLDHFSIVWGVVGSKSRGDLPNATTHDMTMTLVN